MTRLEITIRNRKVDTFAVAGDKLPPNANVEIIRNINNILERYSQNQH